MPKALKIIGVILGSAVALFTATVAAAVIHIEHRFKESAKYDATFESSDGLWMDRTVDIKGRNFRAVLWCFEAYKLKSKQPHLILVRITPEPEKKNGDVKWKVPLAVSSGRAANRINGYSPAELAEIERRADAAYQYWRGI